MVTEYCHLPAFFFKARETKIEIEWAVYYFWMILYIRDFVICFTLEKWNHSYLETITIFFAIIDIVFLSFEEIVPQ